MELHCLLITRVHSHDWADCSLFLFFLSVKDLIFLLVFQCWNCTFESNFHVQTAKSVPCRWQILPRNNKCIDMLLPPQCWEYFSLNSFASKDEGRLSSSQNTRKYCLFTVGGVMVDKRAISVMCEFYSPNPTAIYHFARLLSSNDVRVFNSKMIHSLSIVQFH